MSEVAETTESDLTTPETSSPSVEGTTTDSSTPTDSTGVPIEIGATPDRYRYKGRPLSDYEAGYMRQQDYTQKTTQIAQERRFYDNLAVDLDRVRANPQLAEQFRQIYPDKFHAYLRYVMSENSSNPSSQQPSQPTQNGSYARLDPGMESRIMTLERSFREKEVAAIQSDLDSKFKTLSSKYPYADEEAVVARAQALLVKMKEIDPTNPNLKISEKQWDALWKSQHDRAYQLADTNYKKMVKSQVDANKKGSGVGKGGGIPGQAPRQFKTIKEATNAALSDIEAGSF